jgi:hypothetical protein
LSKQWCIPPCDDAVFAFVAAMEDVLDLYCLPYDERYPVICLDEKPYQLLDNILAPIPMKPGKPAKIDYEYKRCGTCSIFVLNEPLTGWTYTNTRDRRTAIDFAHEIKKLLTVYYPNAIKIRLVLDNLNTHVAASLYKAFPAKEARAYLRRLELHYTPKHGSWLNMAEISISLIARQCINRRIENIEKLNNELLAWSAEYNKNRTPINWQFTSEDARIKLRRLYPLG